MDCHDYYVYLYLRETDSVHGPAGSPYYVGKGKGMRAWKTNRHQIKPPHNRSNIVILLSGLREAEAYADERYLVQVCGRINNGTGCLRNLTDGGRGPLASTHSLETREKMSKSHFGKTTSSQTRAKLSKIMKDRGKPKPASIEARAKISAANKGRTSNRKGAIHSDESIQKMKAAHQERHEAKRQEQVDRTLNSFYDRIYGRSTKSRYPPDALPSAGYTRVG